MKGFKLNESGDVEISNREIVMISGNDLTRQTVQSVLGTNKGEWFLNEDEGINFKNILGKKEPEHQEGTATKQYYEQRIRDIKSGEQTLAEKLSKRLSGE